jgi:hypothetical protein
MHALDDLSSSDVATIIESLAPCGLQVLSHKNSELAAAHRGGHLLNGISLGWTDDHDVAVCVNRAILQAILDEILLLEHNDTNRLLVVLCVQFRRAYPQLVTYTPYLLEESITISDWKAHGDASLRNTLWYIDLLDTDTLLAGISDAFLYCTSVVSSTDTSISRTYEMRGDICDVLHGELLPAKKTITTIRGLGGIR